jgi:hypothetical protein
MGCYERGNEAVSNWWSWFWENLWSWDFWGHLGKVAPVMTVLAVAIAVWSLASQKRIARRRAAIDFFLKTETDAHMLEAHRLYRQAVEVLQSEPDVALFAGSGDYEEHYTALRRYLNVHELLAVGVNHKVFDTKACKAFWSGELEDAFCECNRLLLHLQREDRTILGDFTALRGKWKRGY